MMLRRAAYLVPIILVASVEINARPPVQTEPGLRQAPAPGAPVRAAGLRLTGALVSKPGQPVVVAIRGDNPLDTPLDARVEVRVMERPASHMMARMVPMPRERAHRTVEVALGPHETLDHQVRFGGLKHLVSKKRNKMMSPATMYVQVRLLPPKPLARR
jgi:hypothetical protein